MKTIIILAAAALLGACASMRPSAKMHNPVAIGYEVADPVNAPGAPANVATGFEIPESQSTSGQAPPVTIGYETPSSSSR